MFLKTVSAIGGRLWLPACAASATLITHARRYGSGTSELHVYGPPFVELRRKSKPYRIN